MAGSKRHHFNIGKRKLAHIVLGRIPAPVVLQHSPVPSRDGGADEGRRISRFITRHERLNVAGIPGGLLRGQHGADGAFGTARFRAGRGDRGHDQQGNRSIGTRPFRMKVFHRFISLLKQFIRIERIPSPRYPRGLHSGKVTI